MVSFSPSSNPPPRSALSVRPFCSTCVIGFNDVCLLSEKYTIVLRKTSVYIYTHVHTHMRTNDSDGGGGCNHKTSGDPHSRINIGLNDRGLTTKYRVSVIARVHIEALWGVNAIYTCIRTHHARPSERRSTYGLVRSVGGRKRKEILLGLFLSPLVLPGTRRQHRIDEKK